MVAKGDDPFLLGPGLFSGAMFVLGSVREMFFGLGLVPIKMMCLMKSLDIQTPPKRRYLDPLNLPKTPNLSRYVDV